MGDAVYNALDAFERFMDQPAGVGTWIWIALVFVSGSLGTFVHELGHALVARREGVPVRALAAQPQGPAVTFRRHGLFVRIGLGLGRQVRSKEPAGFVVLDLPPGLEPKAGIRIFAAGPAAQAAYGVLLVCIAAFPVPTIPRVLLVIEGVVMVLGAAHNLFAPDPRSDGAYIAAFLEAANAPGEPALEPPPWVDARTRNSVPPPGA